jgi:hypothetical protein
MAKKSAPKVKKPVRSEKKPAAKKKPPAKAEARPAARDTKARPPAKGAATKPAAPPAPARPAPPARKKAGPPRTVAVTVGSPVASKLGTKWNCFRCGSKFYDLAKSEPLCPKCGADQRQRPKVSPEKPSTPPPAKKPPRPMAPLLDDEDDGAVRYDEEFDLGLRTEVDDAEDDLFPTGDVEEEDVFGGGEEE